MLVLQGYSFVKWEFLSTIAMYSTECNVLLGYLHYVISFQNVYKGLLWRTVFSRELQSSLVA